MERQFVRAILRNTSTALIAVDERGDILDLTNPAARLFGYERNELVRCPLSALLPPDTRLRHKEFMKVFAASSVSDVSMGGRGTVRGYRKDGSTFPLAVSISKFHDKEKGWVFVAIARDMQARRMTEEELEWRATHDALTGLPNRSFILDHLGRSLENAARQGTNPGIVLINLDWFSLINDAFGHANADGLLIDIGARIRSAVPTGHILGRIGSDEFLIVIEDASDPDRLIRLAETVIEELRAPFQIDRTEIFQSCSIGMALGEAGLSSGNLLARASAAMRQAKSGGERKWRLHDDTASDDPQRTLTLVNLLRTAVARDEFYALFQPIVDSMTSVTHGLELLVRWRTQCGEVAPTEFIPIAERSGMIGQIGDWTFARACQMRTQLRLAYGMAAPYVSVNLSPMQLQDGSLAKRFEQIACREGTDRGGIQIEITESVLMTEIADARALIGELSELGFRIAIDDFGAGYSSLAQILRFPVDVIKVDRELVQNLPFDSGSQTIARAIRNIARETGKELVLEGIESEEQRQHIEGMDCRLMQGYYFSKPLLVQQLSEFLQAYPPKSSQPVVTDALARRQGGLLAY